MPALEPCGTYHAGWGWSLKVSLLPWMVLIIVGLSAKSELQRCNSPVLIYIRLGRERHCESRVSSPGTQHNVLEGGEVRVF